MLPPPPPRRPRSLRRRALRAALWTLAGFASLVVVLIVAVALLASSDAGLPYVTRQLTRLTDGKLEIDGARGSLLSKLSVAQLRWRGATTTIVASDVVVEWDPSALARRQLRIHALGARVIDLAVAPSAHSSSDLPNSLGLPLAVVIEHASVTTLNWKLGERAGKVTGLAFAYRGDAREHHLDELALAFERGRINGALSLDAAAPFAITGRAAFAGSDDLDGVGADATIAGTLARIGVHAQGQASDARFDAQAQLTPFADAPLDTLDIDATNVDLARFDARWPHSAFALTARARPAAGGFAGTLSLVNATPGRIDAGRIPLLSMAAGYAQAGDKVTLTGIDAKLAGDGRAQGNLTIALAARDVSGVLALERIDLNALHASLASTRVGGMVRVAIDAGGQSFQGDIADRARALSLSFAARAAGGRLVLSRARLVAAAGTLEGRGEMALTGNQAFLFDAKATHFDPSRLGAFPQGTLEGSVKLTGALAPAWQVAANVALLPGARLGAQPASGHAQATLRKGVARDVSIDLAVGASHVAAAGNAGASGDVLKFSIDAPSLADLATLVPADIARVTAGTLHATGALAIEPAGISGHVEATATGLRFTDGVTVQTLAFDADVAPPAAAGAMVSASLAQRALKLDAEATGVTSASRSVARATAHVRGTLAMHTLTLDASDAGDTLALAAHGALDLDAKSPAWRGTLDKLDLGGALALALAAPASVEVATQRAHIGTAKITIAGGNLSIGDFVVDHGRISSRGEFADLPLATLAQLGGKPLPLASTLTLQGAWSLAASPRINGTLSIRNQHGDLFAAGNDIASAGYALGITQLALEATARDDAWTFAGTLESRNAGRADLRGTLGAGTEPGVPSLDVPVRLSLRASLASLAPLQPWLGSVAVVDGRATLDLRGEGTLHAPVLSGTFAGDALRVDAPQWGLALSDGRLRASLAKNVITLDEFAFKGGDGHFSATGTLARAGAGDDGDGARVAWRADHFRLLNRPDLRVVMSGSGTIATASKKLALAGKITIDDGHIAYSPHQALLGDDVVIKGRPRADENARDLRFSALQLDLDVDLGRSLTFEGEGLETALGGRVHVTTAANGSLLGQGTISAVRGTYYAFGQQLTIDRGRLIFDGPLDNPALDIVALRKNLQVEAGVALTGTVRLPSIQLTSNPPVPDNEKLAWLVTGQAPGRGNSADAAALAAAAASLAGSGGRPIGTQIAQRFGLDDISVRSQDVTPTSGTSPATGQVVAIGKRLSNRLTLVYEQGLTVATNALRLEYTLSRTLTLRVEAGTISGIGIFYRRSYD